MFKPKFVRRVQLELMVTQYIASCGGPIRDKEARRQARELITEGPYNPMK
jgi:hypothetical protein